jgi:hypothetical protein
MRGSGEERNGNRIIRKVPKKMLRAKTEAVTGEL